MYEDVILRFFREDIGGILITGEDGSVLCEDEKAKKLRAGQPLTRE